MQQFLDDSDPDFLDEHQIFNSVHTCGPLHRMQAAVANAAASAADTAAAQREQVDDALAAAASQVGPSQRAAVQPPDAAEVSEQVATSLSLLQSLLARQPPSSGVLRSLTTTVDALGILVYEGGLLQAHKNATANRAPKAKQTLLSDFMAGRITQTRVDLDEQ